MQGKDYKDVIKLFGDRQRNMIKNVLKKHIRRGIKKL
jgi:hypothetical protein